MRRFITLLVASLTLSAPSWAECVNLNTAGLAELDTLPGIGAAYAQRILDYRATIGTFTTPQQIDNVSGIGPATLGKILPFLCPMDGSAPVAPPATPAAPPTATGTPPATTDTPPAATGTPPATTGTPPATTTTTTSTAAVTSATPPATPPTGRTININTATLSELDELPQIGPTKAQAIIDERAVNGLFASCDDLRRVKGIGPTTLETLRPFCTVK